MASRKNPARCNKVSSSRLEGTLALADDNCRIAASASPSYSGLLSCRNGEGVPIHFSIGETTK
jgi:hypothetical protein